MNYGLNLYLLRYFSVDTWKLSVFISIVTYIIVVYVIYNIYCYLYFNGKDFAEIRGRVEIYVNNCNDLNEHIEELKKSYINTRYTRLDYGKGEFVDKSKFSYKRPEFNRQINASNVHKCSRSVVSGAEQKPFKYICKYFNIEADEKTVEEFESVLNDFIAAENGKKLLIDEKETIIQSINSEIPFLIKKFSMKKLSKKLGFHEIDLSDAYYPKYTFQYTSPGGNASYATDIVLDVDNLERFIKFLAEQVEFRKTVQGQRQLMTKALREEIKERDNYTCKHCNISIMDEPHLLLEIDHIIPLAKGGLTEVDNLQTLCWKCNRTKGAK